MDLKASEAESFWLGLFLMGAVFAVALVGPVARIVGRMVAEREKVGGRRQ